MMFKRLLDLYERKTNLKKYYIKRGLKIGQDCRLIGDVDFGSEPYLISIGDHVSITSSSFVTHDGGVWVFRQDLPKIDVIAPIRVGNNVFIGSNCIIMPGVVIGDNVVVGAGSIVTKSLESDSVYAGVPARRISDLAAYKAKILPKTIESKHLNADQKKEYLLKKFSIK